MKVLLFSGSHNRHLFVQREFLRNFEVCGVVAMKREAEQVEAPAGILPQDHQNFVRHFNARLEVERKTYGEIDQKQLFGSVPTHWTSSEDLNASETVEFVKSCQADIAFIFGVDLILGPLLEAMPKEAINLHLGLSPWYRGSATLFWPFYNLEPQFCGSTIHQIVAEADAGSIIHQVACPLKSGDRIHDVGARTILTTLEELIPLFKKREEVGHFPGCSQKSTGRLYLTKAFKPEHLRVIYNLYNDDIVDRYLKGELSQHYPRLIRSEFIEKQ